MKISTEPADVAKTLFLWLTERGITRYDGSVTQLEHGLHTAHLASKESANRYNKVAARLHDVAHLMLGEHEGSVGLLNSDLSHETIGSQWIDNLFGKQVPGLMCYREVAIDCMNYHHNRIQ